MKGIYLGACRALHPNHNIVYQDINGKRDIAGDMLDIDISNFDYVIATPPCNWWSQANPYYWRSEYALKTRHLLPLILIKLSKSQIPFVVECVKNLKRYRENYIFRICDMYGISYQVVGRHIYFSNRNYNLYCEQIQDFRYGGIRVNNDKYNQGGTNVHNCLEIWIKAFEDDYHKSKMML